MTGLAVFGLAAAITVAVIWLGRRLRSFSVALLIGLGALTGIWVTGEVLRDADWHDIDGFIDCYPSCGFWHGVGALLFWGPPVTAIVLVVAVPIAAARYGRRSRDL